MNLISRDLYLLDCKTYEDYLHLFITKNDIRYLRNHRFARELVQLGYRTKTAVLTPEQFHMRKTAAYESLWPSKKTAILFSDGMTSRDPVLLELKLREKPNAQKTLVTIIFLRHRLKSGFEVSGYIDYEHSLRRCNMHADEATDWKNVFLDKVKLRPKPNHLSFCDWHSNQVVYNDSDNFVIIHDYVNGLTFMHTGDHKTICVGKDNPENCTRTMAFSEKYGYVVFYDHVIRKKS